MGNDEKIPATEDTEDTVIRMRLETLTDAVWGMSDEIRNLRNMLIFSMVIFGALYWKGII